jgi:hypothetical protein
MNQHAQFPAVEHRLAIPGLVPPQRNPQELAPTTDSPLALMKELRLLDAVRAAEQELNLALDDLKRVEALCTLLSICSATGAYDSITRDVVLQVRTTIECNTVQPEYMRTRAATIWAMTLTGLLTERPAAGLSALGRECSWMDASDEFYNTVAISLRRADTLEVTDGSDRIDNEATKLERSAAYHRIFLTLIAAAQLGRNFRAFDDNVRNDLAGYCYNKFAKLAPSRAHLLLGIYDTYACLQNATTFNFDYAEKTVSHCPALTLLIAEHKAVRQLRFGDTSAAYQTLSSALSSESTSPLSLQIKKALYNRLTILLLADPTLGNGGHVAAQWAHLVDSGCVRFDVQRLLLHPDTWGIW